MATRTGSLKYAASTIRNLPSTVRLQLCVAIATQNKQALRDFFDAYIAGHKIENVEVIPDRIVIGKMFG